MRAALRLRLLEAWRRGGMILLLVGVGLVVTVSLFAGATPDGRYGLASDLAATLGYLGAVFYGAFPIAIDRERKRSYLPSASPVTPWAWALGNGFGAAAAAGLAAFLFFAAAGIGTAAGGGIATHQTYGSRSRGASWLSGETPRRIRIHDDVTSARLVFRTALVTEHVVGTPDAATVEVNGRLHEIYPDLPITVPVASPHIVITNRSPEFRVGIVMHEMIALGRERSFLGNALGAALAPALGAAALAAVAVAAGANLTAPVAALLAVVLLFVASLKGFLHDTLTHEGAVRASREKSVEPNPLRDAARGVVKSVLAVLPDLSELDRTDRVAAGRWTGVRKSGRPAALILLVSLALAGLLGGLGVHARRMP